MTDRYPLDPRDEIRECSECNGRSPLSSCVPCTGRGYVVGREVDVSTNMGIEEWRFVPAAAQRVIEVWQRKIGDWLAMIVGEKPALGKWDEVVNIHGVWGWSTIPWLDPQPTKDEALLAARCAVWGVTTLGYGRDCPRYVYFLNGEESRCNYLTPTDALCAAIDAMETR